jgi:hypothetical protein
MSIDERAGKCRARLVTIYRRKTPPELEEYLLLLERVNRTLDNEDRNIRPHDSQGRPGGIVYLDKTIPSIIVPDIHARMDFFLNVLLYKEAGLSNLERLAADEIQIVCVGDGFHAEGRARERWSLAFNEYREGYRSHRYMDDEMRESLGVMQMVKEMKCTFSNNFHFLKGNHENIANEEGEGNHPFRKFSHEGIMVAEYIRRFYGEEFLKSYSAFEKRLPLLVIGRNFLVSHAEPLEFYDRESIIEYRKNPQVVEGLTWTANDDADTDSVNEMLEYYLDKEIEGPHFYFGGHRPVRGLYNRRADGRYIQIHNPDKFIMANIPEEGAIDIEEHIIEIENRIEELIAY